MVGGGGVGMECVCYLLTPALAPGQPEVRLSPWSWPPWDLEAPAAFESPDMVPGLVGLGGRAHSQLKRIEIPLVLTLCVSRDREKPPPHDI